MLELSIRLECNESVEGSPISASLFRPDTGASIHPIPFEPPLNDAQLGELRWYLEVYSGWPTGPDYDRAQRVETRLEDWGRNLRDSVISTTDTARVWQQFLDAETQGKLLTVDATDPRVVRLPWELLADESGHIFARGISLRRRLQRVTSPPVKPFPLPVRVLVVVSRPRGVGFLDPRTDARAVLDALDGLGGRAEVEFLYPPTLQALTERLRDRGAPPVHVVHFDGHGIYDAKLGLGYLLFEGQGHRRDLVDAPRLGTLLQGCGTPLMVLSACQSAAQEEANPYASVAARLIQAGVGSVLAMNYSVLMATAKKFVAAFYGGLASGLTVGQAVDGARVALLADEARHTLTRLNARGDLVEETVTLRDWFVPALYQRAADPVVFSPEALPSKREPPPVALTDPKSFGGLPAEPLHGFQGRARELLELERALAERAVVVLHGFGGIGKTALATEAGRWFYNTGRFPAGAAFISFEHGGSLSQLCSWVGQAVGGDPNFMAEKGAPVARVADLLAKRPALVILDNFESVLGRQPEMPAQEVKGVLDAVWSWVVDQEGTDSRVLITTRDTRFGDARFGPSRRCAHLRLEGLSRPDALTLAAAVLDDQGIDRATVERQGLEDLMDYLGGHPLSLYLVLPHLRRYAPSELIARFEERLPGFTAGAARGREESLAISLEFSLERLGEGIRALLPALGVFQGGAFEDDLLAITEIDPDLWPAARAELEGASLMTAESPPGIIPPFLDFHPTLAPYLTSQLPPSRRAALEERYRRRYHARASYLYQEDRRHPHQARALALRELPNLRRALDLTIAAGEADAAVDFAVRIARFLDAFGRWREREAMMESLASLPLPTVGEIAEAEYLLLSGRAEALFQQGRAAEAEELFSGLLERLRAGAAFDAAYAQAVTLLRLGRCLAARGRPEEAISLYEQAFQPISASSQAAKGISAAAYTGLADCLCALGRFEQAERAYQAGLAIFSEVGDQRGQAVVLVQMGTLAAERGDLAEARRRHTEALETFQALGEPRSEAAVWHQLGRATERAADWAEAERCYRESLRLEEQLNNTRGVASTCNQLGIVAEGARRPGDAERWYLRALGSFEGLGDAASQVKVLYNLADLYLSQGRLDEAERHARQAAEIERTLDLSAHPWKTYAILAQVAEARGPAEEAAAWRRREQDSYGAYSPSSEHVQPWERGIAAIVEACQGNTQARAIAEGIVAHYLDGQDWRDLAIAFRRVLDGERDLGVLRVGLDRVAYVIVRELLTRLARPGPISTEAEGSADNPPALRNQIPDESAAVQRDGPCSVGSRCFDGMPKQKGAL